MRSLLELRMGGLPYPRGTARGEWRYRHAVRPEGPGELDRQSVADFLRYERGHGRSVSVLADAELAGWERWRAPEERPHPGLQPKQCCSQAYPEGCGGALVCHGTPAELAVEILREGALLPATLRTGRTAAALAAESAWGEPPDYFEHVMLANGSCLAPQAVAESRRRRRALVPAELGPAASPAVRLYFEWTALASQPAAAFDGVHPVKIRGAIDLEAKLVAAVAPDGCADRLASASRTLSGRIVALDARGLGPTEWASRALAAAIARLG